jgi:hypothetical protein
LKKKNITLAIVEAGGKHSREESDGLQAWQIIIYGRRIDAYKFILFGGTEICNIYSLIQPL